MIPKNKFILFEKMLKISFIFITQTTIVNTKIKNYSCDNKLIEFFVIEFLITLCLFLNHSYIVLY